MCLHPTPRQLPPLLDSTSLLVVLPAHDTPPNNCRRARVKGFISYAGPFGGAVTAIAPRINGELTSLVPPELLQGIALPIPGIDALVREVTWNGVKGMASLAMLAPYSEAYANGTDPVSTLVPGWR
jgi:hypothetical protein